MSKAKTTDLHESKNSNAEMPLIDLSKTNTGLKRLISVGKERGYITYDELNEALPQDEMSSEKIDQTMTMISEIGISIIDADEVEEHISTNNNTEKNFFSDTPFDAENDSDDTDENAGRTDDPVRMYLREMGNVKLLSREGEISIAKRIEAGKKNYAFRTM